MDRLELIKTAAGRRIQQVLTNAIATGNMSCEDQAFVKLELHKSTDCDLCKIRRQVARIDIPRPYYPTIHIDICASCTLEILHRLIDRNVARRRHATTEVHV